MSLNSRFTMPDSMLKQSFADTGGFVTQRKAYDQGTTKQAFAWSFGRKNTPYYCCQCGKLQEKLGESCLKILPPESTNSPCIWVINKNAATPTVLQEEKTAERNNVIATDSAYVK